LAFLKTGHRHQKCRLLKCLSLHKTHRRPWGFLVAESHVRDLRAANCRLTPRVMTGDARSDRLQFELALVAIILGLMASWQFTQPFRTSAQVATGNAKRSRAFPPLS
jgi:hypothetical protein